VDTFAPGESSHGYQVAQAPVTSVSQYYAQTADPSIAPSLLGWTPTYSISDAAASFSALNASHQNANLDQVSHYAPQEAYAAYGRNLLLESPSTTRLSSDRNTFGEFGFGAAGMQAGFMTPYSDTMPESSEYYRPA